jgi:hypothetical protein
MRPPHNNATSIVIHATSFASSLLAQDSVILPTIFVVVFIAYVIIVFTTVGCDCVLISQDSG